MNKIRTAATTVALTGGAMLVMAQSAWAGVAWK